MTALQEAKIIQIREAVKRQFFYSKDYEMKKFEVEETKYFVSVFAEVGLKGDEGTLAQAFARTGVHLFVGPRGGITYWKKHCKKTVHLSSLTNLHSVLLDQGMYSF